MFWRSTERIFWNICLKFFITYSIQVKDVQFIPEISLLENPFFTSCICYLHFKFMKVLPSIRVVEHCCETGHENTSGVEVRAGLLCFFFDC